jgi:hypothetical protein
MWAENQRECLCVYHSAYAPSLRINTIRSRIALTGSGRYKLRFDGRSWMPQWSCLRLYIYHIILLYSRVEPVAQYFTLIWE